MSLRDLVRPNIWRLQPYSSARHEFEGQADVYLDANENPYGSAFSRYPDPLQLQLKQVIARYKSMPVDQIFLGNGSDEAIDLIMRIFCRPGIDEILVLFFTYGMYKVSADICDVKVNECLLTSDYQIDVEGVRQAITPETKVLFICSPNNPTGNLMDRERIEEVFRFFHGIVVIDEAYMDFAPANQSWLRTLVNYPNLVILQTFSKAWGLAGIRLGLAYASKEIIHLMNKVKPPYNVNQLTQKAALDALTMGLEKKEAEVIEINSERKRLTTLLEDRTEVLQVFPSEANFLLVKFSDPAKVFQHLKTAGIVVRDRSKTPLCEGCLRITIGTPEENNLVLETLNLMI